MTPTWGKSRWHICNSQNQFFIAQSMAQFVIFHTKLRLILLYLSQIDKGSIWVFEQPQSLAFSNVTTNCRMTVIKLASGGLWVHAPIAPTPECLRLLKELDAPVEYIILPTFAYEHKIFVGPFSRKFPKAKVYIAPKYVLPIFI